MNNSTNLLFRILVWLFLVAVIAQIYLAGMVVVARQLPNWNWHTSLGHMMGFILIPMLIVVYLGRASRDVKLLTWVLFVVWFIQVYVLAIFLRESMPLLAAFHPVLALFDFWLAWRLLGLSKTSAAA